VCTKGTGQTSNEIKKQQSESASWKKIDKLCLEVESKVISWRQDFHQNPELGNREFRTSKIIAEHLKSLGLEVQTNVAHTGVVAVLKGKSETPVIALRADIDALPVKEMADVPFASKVVAEYNGNQVPVAHACGHDAHTAMLMGVAEVLSKVKGELSGTVKFIFEPAEDSNATNEESGAELMIKEGVLDNPKVDAIFGLHVAPYPASGLYYRTGGLFAGVNNFTVIVKGKQTHGAMPWTGTDAITVSAQIITGLQTIISRQIDITEAPAIITVGTINGGSQVNILPGEVKFEGTLRTFSPVILKDIEERMTRTVTNIAESSGATATISFTTGVPAVYNDPALTEMLLGTFNRAAGNSALVSRPFPVGDDFSAFTRNIPGFYFILGTAPKGVDPFRIINHSPYFIIDETALVKGVEAMSHLAFDYLKLKGNKIN
jgi:amidohydrolase